MQSEIDTPVSGINTAISVFKFVLSGTDLNDTQRVIINDRLIYAQGVANNVSTISATPVNVPAQQANVSTAQIAPSSVPYTPKPGVLDNLTKPNNDFSTTPVEFQQNPELSQVSHRVSSGATSTSDQFAGLPTTVTFNYVTYNINWWTRDQAEALNPNGTRFALLSYDAVTGEFRIIGSNNCQSPCQSHRVDDDQCKSHREDSPCQPKSHRVVCLP